MPVDLEPPGQKDRADDQERHQRQHLDQRGPELQLTEELDRDQVHRQHHHERYQREGPLRDDLERLPEVAVVRDRGGIHDPGHRPVQEVHPAGGESHLLPEEFAGVGHEGSRRRAVQHQLAERAQDQEHEDAADPVDDEQSRAPPTQAVLRRRGKGRFRWRRRGRSSESGGSKGPCDSPRLRARAARRRCHPLTSSSCRNGSGTAQANPCMHRTLADSKLRRVCAEGGILRRFPPSAHGQSPQRTVDERPGNKIATPPVRMIEKLSEPRLNPGLTA